MEHCRTPLYVQDQTSLYINRAACQVHFHPYLNMTMDKRMVETKAYIHMKQYMKDKSVKRGYRLFVDSSTTYTWNFFVYTGKSVLITGRGLSYSVMELITFPHFQDLLDKDIGCCETIRKNWASSNSERAPPLKSHKSRKVSRSCVLQKC